MLRMQYVKRTRVWITWEWLHVLMQCMLKYSQQWLWKTCVHLFHIAAGPIVISDKRHCIVHHWATKWLHHHWLLKMYCVSASRRYSALSLFVCEHFWPGWLKYPQSFTEPVGSVYYAVAFTQCIISATAFQDVMHSNQYSASNLWNDFWLGLVCSCSDFCQRRWPCEVWQCVYDPKILRI